MVTCAACRQTISGSYQQALNKTWHPKCLLCFGCRRPLGLVSIVLEGIRPYHEKCFKCAGCNRPIGKDTYTREGNLPFHSDCHRQRFGKKCHGCGGVIEGVVLDALGGFWHGACFTCAGCNQPLKGRKFLKKDNHPYHEKCYHASFTKRCDICEEPLREGGLKDPWGNSYCTIHQRKLPKCFSCGRLICNKLTKGGTKYKDDDRTVCNICGLDAVKEMPRASQLFETVREKMRHLGFSLGDASIPFRLVDQRELRGFSQKWKQRPVLGMARATKTCDSRGRIVDRQFKEIVILYGLPEEQFRVVVAHELCHAWFFFNHFDNLPEKVEEGLCTLAEFFYLREEKTQEAAVRIAALEAANDRVYGAGFRAARKALKKRTLSGLLKYVKQKRRFPGFAPFGIFG